MLLKDANADYLLFIKHELGHSSRTFEMYQSRLRFYVNWLEENGYPCPTLDAFVTPILRRFLYAQSERGLRPRTIRGLFHPLVGLGDFLVSQNALVNNPAREIKMPKKDAAERLLATDAELSAIMDVIERQADPHAVAFQRALFSTLINCGPRAQELLDLQVGHYSPQTKTILIAHGKGEKSRTLHPPPDCIAAITEWLVFREQMQCRHDYLWAITVTRRIGYEGLRTLLEEVKARAGLAEHHNIKCHAIRRAFASRMMARGASIKAIQAALGHSMAETTFQYLFMAEAEAKAMATLGALASPTAKPVEPSQKPAIPTQKVVKMIGKAKFLSVRRRTPSR